MISLIYYMKNCEFSGRFVNFLHEKLKDGLNFFPKKISEHARLLETLFFACKNISLVQNRFTLDRSTINKTDRLQFSLISDRHVSQSLVHLKNGHWKLCTPFLQAFLYKWHLSSNATLQCRNLFYLAKCFLICT